MKTELTDDVLIDELKSRGYIPGCLWPKDDIRLSIEEMNISYTENDIDDIAELPYQAALMPQSVLTGM